MQITDPTFIKDATDALNGMGFLVLPARDVRVQQTSVLLGYDEMRHMYDIAHATSVMNDQIDRRVHDLGRWMLQKQIIHRERSDTMRGINVSLSLLTVDPRHLKPIVDQMQKNIQLGAGDFGAGVCAR